jgi:GT2 family glycosyltransferase
LTRSRVGVAIATRDRRERVLDAVLRIRALPERPRVVVVDNASGDGTADALRRRFGAVDGAVEVVELPSNRGAAARTEAVERLSTPYVALRDDDSWWDPGALARAEALLDAHPRLALIAAHVVVGAERREDPTCAAMRDSPLADGSGPGVPVLGFVACGAIVRRDAFLATGGFHPRYLVGGEEQLVALDLLAAGCQVRYVDSVIAHHCPPRTRHGAVRAARTVRNDLWTIWLRRARGSVARATARRLTAAGWNRGATLAGAVSALGGLPWVLRERRPVPAAVERGMRALERGSVSAG